MTIKPNDLQEAVKADPELLKEKTTHHVPTFGFTKIHIGEVMTKKEQKEHQAKRYDQWMMKERLAALDVHMPSNV